MMKQQFLEEIKRLSVEERIALLEAITHSLREDLATHQEATSNARNESGQTTTQEAGRATLSQRLRGVLKFDGAPPTDEELEEMRTDYLTEKYS